MSGAFDFAAHQRARCTADPGMMKRAAAPRVGKPLSAATKAKISASQRARMADPAARAVLAAAALGKVASPETRAKKRAAMLGKPKTDAHAFHTACTKLGMPAALVLAIHSDLVSLSLVHGVTLADMRRIAGSRALLTATPREVVQATVALPPVPPPVQAAPQRKCLGCQRPIARERGIFMCRVCKAGPSA